MRSEVSWISTYVLVPPIAEEWEGWSPPPREQAKREARRASRRPGFAAAARSHKTVDLPVRSSCWPQPIQLQGPPRLLSPRTYYEEWWIYQKHFVRSFQFNIPSLYYTFSRSHLGIQISFPRSLCTATMMRSALHSLPLLAFLPSAFSAAYFDNSINCEMKDTATPPFEVCGVTEGSSPSPGLIEGPDGEITQIYLGGWSNSFYITQGLSEGKFWSPFDDEAEEYDTDIVVNVARDDDDMCTGVTVSGERCNSCEYCGDGKYSADCTNLANGRMVDCEGTQFGSIFFPLEASALPTSSPPPPIEDDTLTVMIQGKSSAGIEACWEVRNGNTNKVGNKIVLGRCAGKDKNTFVLKAKVGPDGNTYYQVSPKLNDKMVVTGVRVSDEKAWVRIEKSTKVAFDETQSFYALDSGMVGMGIQSECSNEKTCLFVTNQGLDINLGDPVMLSTEKRLKHFAKNGDNIMEWTFIPEN